MAEVAKVANVSISTVSHVINGTRLVREDTERAVRAAIDALGYVRNTIARPLVATSTQTLGLAISGISNFYFANVMASIEQAIGRTGYTLLLAETHDDIEQELKEGCCVVRSRGRRDR
jgi:LacI family transcriptional regulator